MSLGRGLIILSLIQPHKTAPASSFRPYISAGTHLRELTAPPLILGTILGMVFGASSLYLVLKVGMTVSASIPVAVVSITFFRIFSRLGLRNATILENNITQTAGSAGESIAFGVGATMPAILILGFDLEITRVMLVAVLGGLLGILMMIPLRQPLIVQEHGTLKYPEGTACAEVLKAAASPESKAAADPSYEPVVEENVPSAKVIFSGFGIGLGYKLLMLVAKGWKEVPEKIFTRFFKGGSVSAEISPELLGVGYIIGPAISATLCAGGVLAYLVLIPAIKFFGEGLAEPLAPGTIPIREMGPSAIRGAYILYIGAGAVATGGIISLLQSFPTIWGGLKSGLRDVRGARQARQNAVARTDRDLPMVFVLSGIVLLVILIMVAKPLQMNFLGALFIIAFGFLFVTVSSRLTGEIGSSSNPISGMTVATLLLTCLIFYLLGWTGPAYYVTALSVGAIVCIAAANGGAISQDLKTGFLVGATPSSQQIAILIGAFSSAIILGPILIRLNEAATVYVPPTTVESLPSQEAGALPPEIVATLPPVIPAEAPLRRFVHSTNSGSLFPALKSGTYLVDPSGKVVKRVSENFPSDLRADVRLLQKRETLKGPQARDDARSYLVWNKPDDRAGPAGRYLVDDQGRPVYLVDPGINGIYSTRPDGTKVTKFEAPKATLMSYIIKGILNRQLPWGLVLLGVMIAIVFHMSGISALAFAVGVYLPLSTSSPIFVGGLIRWLVDRRMARNWGNATGSLSPAMAAAEGDRSPGVLLASGYIAGGAIAGILVAFMAGTLTDLNNKITNWANAHNPVYNGPLADLLSLLPFLLLSGLLLLVGWRMIWGGPQEPRARAARA